MNVEAGQGTGVAVGQRWLARATRTPITITAVDKRSVHYRYDGDGTGREYWRLRSSFLANFSQATTETNDIRGT
jgi:hypothetical protein